MLPNSVSPEMLAAAGLNADLLAKLSAPATTTAANTGIAAPIPVVATMPNPSPQLSGFMDWLQQYANPGLPSAPLAAIPPPPISTYSLHPSGSMEATHTRSDSKDTEPEGMKELVHKVQRRLHQNRESARKCRQRKKAYLQELEEELHLLRRQHEEAKQHKITNVATGLSANTSREGAEAIAALLKWQQDWEAALGRVRRLINAAGTDDQLQAAIAHCTEVMSKRKLLVADLIRKDVFAVMAGDHVSPEQRMTLWLGGPRPSRSLDLIMQRLEDVQPNFEHADVLKRLQASWHEMEEAQTSGFEHTKQQIIMTLEAPTGADGTATPQMLGKLDALRIMLSRAEDLRRDCYYEIQSALPLRDFAEAITVPLIAIERLRALHEACMQGR